MASTTFYPDPDPETTSVDGWTNNDATGNSMDDWPTARIQPGSIANDSGTTLTIGTSGSENVNKWSDLWRTHVLFDTSSIPNTDEVISATMSIHGSAKTDGLSTTPGLNMVTSLSASNTALVAGDHPDITTTLQSDTTIAYSSFSITGYNDFVLNAAGRGNINKTGASKFAIRINYDLADSPIPNWVQNAQSSFTAISADTAGTSTDPKLVVVHAFTPQALIF